MIVADMFTTVQVFDGRQWSVLNLLLLCNDYNRLRT